MDIKLSLLISKLRFRLFKKYISFFSVLHVISTAAVYSNERLIDKLTGKIYKTIVDMFFQLFVAEIISSKRIKRQGVQCDSTVELIGW